MYVYVSNNDFIQKLNTYALYALNMRWWRPGNLRERGSTIKTYCLISKQRAIWLAAYGMNEKVRELEIRIMALKNIWLFLCNYFGCVYVCVCVSIK